MGHHKANIIVEFDIIDHSNIEHSQLLDGTVKSAVLKIEHYAKRVQHICIALNELDPALEDVFVFPVFVI